MTVCIVGSKNPVKLNAARSSLSLSLDLPALEAIGMNVPSGVPEQPMNSAETRQGAINRVKACIAQADETSREQDWFIAIEGGVDMFEDGPATFAFVAIYHKNQWSVGRSANLPLPPSVFSALQAGEELGPLMDKLFNTDNIKQKGGAIGLLTNHLATRQSVYELAILLAMAKFNHPNLFAD
ncbi:inosine/xanthosine triphosphatase [Alteromonas confluentis]|uniref:Inosine/xanthosine triphosphatase n=1 Tax=Alteromonas confluentis TaxID=1656094 RepID=A0A1E7ZDP2_9ALTE|nr:inosine/xanthosine triphosphatase [Alteromonas confluentis]OFC71636.1 inosine/xanthosine triphosphatase [Alteromonas confluentis]